MNKLIKIFKKIINLNSKPYDQILKIYFRSIFYRKKHIKKTNYNWLKEIEIELLNKNEGLLKYRDLQFIMAKDRFDLIPLHQKYLYAALISQFDIPKYYLLFWDDLLIFYETFIENIYHKVFKIKNNDIVLDIGASIGWFAYKVSKSVGLNGKIIALEPDPENFNYLNKNVKKNNLQNIVTLNIGIWSKKKSIGFLSNRYVSLIEDLHGFNELGEKQVRKMINVDTIDNIVSDLNLEQINFIKMDIEGAEIEAIKGAINTLKTSKELKLIIAAYHPDSAGKATYKTLIPILVELGFKISIDNLPYIYAWKNC